MPPSTHRSSAVLCHRPSGTGPSPGITSASPTGALATIAPGYLPSHSRRRWRRANGLYHTQGTAASCTHHAASRTHSSHVTECVPEEKSIGHLLKLNGYLTRDASHAVRRNTEEFFPFMGTSFRRISCRRRGSVMGQSILCAPVETALAAINGPRVSDTRPPRSPL